MCEFKNKFTTLFLALFILMAGSGICSAAEIIVHNGESIQAAVSNASEGDIILVEPGTYYEDIEIPKSYVTVKSQSGNPDDTIIYGYSTVNDAYNGATNGATIEGLTLNDNHAGFYGISAFGFAGIKAKNCKIMYYDMGMFADVDATIVAENTQFINCGAGMAGAYLTGVSATNCKFIDCGSAMSPHDESGYYSKNNVEIHTDPSGNQVVTPIPDYPAESSEPEPTKPPANNTTTNTTTPVQPIGPSNNTTVPVEPAVPIPTETPADDSGSSSGGSSHSSSGGSGTGGSPEDQKNVAAKDTAKVFVPNEKQVTFNFVNGVTVVESISFTSKKTMGKITAITEDLKSKSSLVKDLPEGEIYKSFNVWVGNAGYGESDNILDATINFKVEKSWLDEKNIDPGFIVLYKYDEKNKEWIEISTAIIDKDDQYVYFSANVPGYSSFLIAGKVANTQLIEESTRESVAGEIRSTGNGTVIKGTPKESPGFGIISGVICLFGVFLHKRR